MYFSYICSKNPNIYTKNVHVYKQPVNNNSSLNSILNLINLYKKIFSLKQLVVANWGTKIY